MIVNALIHSSTLHYLISIDDVALFLGLTAYDVRLIKRWQDEVDNTDEATFSHLSVLRALKLYLGMVNPVIFLLRMTRR